ncbi:MAG: 1,2-phenylacetyl-CoA epoxidase subunit PaaD [Anaerolineales bacterium]
MVSAEPLTAEAVWAALETVKDPEIPVISVVDLGLIRMVGIEERRVTVGMTPTFLGCPAVSVMQADIVRCLLALGAAAVEVRLELSPPWSSDWISERGRAQLRAFGLAPPARHDGLIQIIWQEEAACPHCGSRRTELKNSFGATLCRSLYYCNNCQQPFEQFKAL